MTKIGRNDPCHCGSGKKYKKCCLKKDQAAAQARQEAKPEAQPSTLAPPPLEPPDPHTEAINALLEKLQAANLLHFINPQYYKATATLELVPAWLRFLESRRLIDAEQRQQTLTELRGLDTEFLKVVENHSDPASRLAMENWAE